MNFYGWRLKEWKFNSNNVEEKRKEMIEWIDKWKHKYDIRQVFINNAWAVEYRMLLKM